MPQAKYKTGDGYIYVYQPEHPACNHRGYIFEHRVLMEKKIGRYLTGKECIHHKDQNPSNNRITNLQLCRDTKEHALIHRPPRFCKTCGKPHHSKGFCRVHYLEQYRKFGKHLSDVCDECSKPIHRTKYETKDGKNLCQQCRFPFKACRVCGKRAAAKGWCKEHYPSKQAMTNCHQCGKRIRLGGRNHMPPVCWDCHFKDRPCEICKKSTKNTGGALGFCANHGRYWYRWSERGMTRKAFIAKFVAFEARKTQ